MSNDQKTAVDADSDKAGNSAEAKLSDVELETPPKTGARANDNSEDDTTSEDSVEISEGEELTEKLQEQLESAREDVLRAAAEAQNARRRAEQDVEKARKFALERFVSDLLPVVDNLERALNAINAEDEALKSVYEGIELTYKSFQESLSRHQVLVIDPVGEPFDPELHQAMSMVPNADIEPNSVIEVFQKGYQLNGRLVRPAMVVVSKAAE